MKRRHQRGATSNPTAEMLLAGWQVGWPFWRSFENDTVSSVRLNKGQGQVPRLAVLHTRGAKGGGGVSTA